MFFIKFADLAHLVERDLAKVEVAGSSPVIRSIWEFSSAGRASALQAECQRFDPVNSHQYGSVVQLVRTLACHARGRGFEPHPSRQIKKACYIACFLYLSIQNYLKQMHDMQLIRWDKKIFRKTVVSIFEKRKRNSKVLAVIEYVYFF